MYRFLAYIVFVIINCTLMLILIVKYESFFYIFSTDCDLWG